MHSREYYALAFVLLLLLMPALTTAAHERQITDARHGHILTNIGVWSPDGRWIVYDVRSDSAGNTFDGRRIERVRVSDGLVQLLYESGHPACCGVATYSPVRDEVVFIHGPERPTTDWQYSACHRRGVVTSANRPGIATNLDARDITPPFTAGALRGGTHVHTFSGDGKWVAFTYEDHVLETNHGRTGVDLNQRNVGVSVPVRTVQVPDSHVRNHSGSQFSVLVTRTTHLPQSGTDQISKAFSDAWVGTHGYVREDGTRQERAIAFQGLVATESDETISEVFIVDIPHDVTRSSNTGPLEGTDTQRPHPPHGTFQRRLTFTADRRFPGVQGVRHWLRSSPDGSQIAFLMKDDVGITQLWTVSPLGRDLRQVTQNPHPISSAFSWSPDGQRIAHTMDESVCVTHVASGNTQRLTQPDSNRPLRSEACVYAPDGKQIAYVREITSGGEKWNQLFVSM